MMREQLIRKDRLLLRMRIVLMMKRNKLSRKMIMKHGFKNGEKRA
jgi:hypothetical protein